MESNIILFSDKDFVNGVALGYYPELNRLQRQNQLKVLDIDSYRSGDMNLDKQPVGQDCMYVLNPFTRQYELLSSSNEEVNPDVAEIIRKRVESKANVLAEALHMMGAKKIVVEKVIPDDTDSGTEVNAEGGAKKVGGSANIDCSKKYSQYIRNCIEKADSESKAENVQYIDVYINTHGVGGESIITTLFERLKRNGKITGKESYLFEFVGELKDDLQIAASVKTPFWNVGATVKTKQEKVHKVTVKVKVDFDSADN